MTVSWVVLTTGDRPGPLAAAVASIAAQDGAGPQEVLVVGNGASVEAPASARAIALPDNVGIAAGRNAGVAATTGAVVGFLDDDAVCATRDLTARVRERFGADPRLGIVSFRIADPASGRTMRRHVPRLRAGDPAASSEVTTFLGGACAIRRALLEEVGGYPDTFFYAMEETDLAWRALDAGWRIEYAGDLVVHHPATTPARHGRALWYTARNRAWLARRRLPWPLVPAYLASWCALTLARVRSAAGAREVLAGFATGLREPAGERRPMRWRTVARMTRLGRPPII